MALAAVNHGWPSLSALPCTFIMPAPQEVTALTDAEGEVVECRAAVYGMAPQGLVETKGCIEGEAVTKKVRKAGDGAKKRLQETSCSG